MLFGYIHDNSLILAGGETIAEMEQAARDIPGAYEPEAYLFMDDPRIVGFAFAFILEEGDPNALAQQYGVEIVSREEAKKRQRNILHTSVQDDRTIAEIHGIELEENHAVFDEKKANAETSGDSFSASKDDDVSVRGISVDADGNVSVSGTKGWTGQTSEVTEDVFIFAPDLDLSSILERYRYTRGAVAKTDEGQLVVSQSLAAQIALALSQQGIDHGCSNAPGPELTRRVGRYPFNGFFMIDLQGVSMDEAVGVLIEAGINMDTVLGIGEYPNPWIGTTVERLALDYAAKIKAAYPQAETEVYGTNKSGERLVPKGTATVIDQNDVQRKLRPWSPEWDAAPQADKEKSIKEIKGSEFCYASKQGADGHEFFVAPVEPFRDSDEPWGGDVMRYAGKFVPEHMVKNGRIVMRYPELVERELKRAGMTESIILKGWINVG